jgi:hypothetical protein
MATDDADDLVSFPDVTGRLHPMPGNRNTPHAGAACHDAGWRSPGFVWMN